LGVRDAPAGRQAGARAALEEALALHRDAGDTVAAARTLTALSKVLRMAGDPTSRDPLAEALRLLEAEEPGTELVNAYTELASGTGIDGAFAEAIAAAERAILLATALGLPEPARALGVRGIARALLGEAQGLSDMRRALALAVVQGLGRDAASLYNNLALVVWQYEGPAAALVLCDEGIEFCERRGIAGMATWIATQRLTFMAACGPQSVRSRTSNSWQRTAKRQAIRLSLRLARSSSLFEADVAREPTPPPRNNLWRSPAGPAAQS